MNIASIVQPYTMASPERVQLLINLASRVIEEKIPGDMVECGVCNGGSAAILAHYAAKDGRKTWLFDSFDGLPPNTKEDTPSLDGGILAESCVGQCVGNIDKVKAVLSSVEADLNQVQIVKGWFCDTFPTVNIPQIAMLNLDSDWYESEKLCLEKFYNNVSVGGFVYFDDFYYWPGCQKAVTEFLNQSPAPIFNQVGHSMWIQKP